MILDNNNACSSLDFFAKVFENAILLLRISDFQNSHLLCLESVSFWSKKIYFSVMNISFHLSTKSLLQINELLKFQKSRPFAKFKHFIKEQKNWEMVY